MKISTLLLMVLLPLIYANLAIGSVNSNPAKLVKVTTTGVFRGKANRKHYRTVYEFLGIPYGKAPTGEERFRLPKPAPFEENIKPATNISQPCYQSLDSTFPGFWGTEMWNPTGEMTEDCLTLNIWTPAFARNAPVLVWIFGGGFISGSPSVDMYDGAFFASMTGQVVVTINYRLGPFGFLSLDSTAPPNVGLLDQRLALQWIRDNIKVFGGAPHHVTLMGESAGAASVMAHLHAEDSWPLFYGAIVHSGSMAMPWANVRKHKLEEYSRTLAHRLGCTGNNGEMVACMRTQTPENIVTQWANMAESYVHFSFVPVIEDDDLFFGPKGLKNYRKGITKVAPILICYNENEGSYWLPLYFPNEFNYTGDGMINSETMEKLTRVSFPYFNDKERSELVTYYREKGRNYRDALSDMIGDYYFTCGVLDLANRLSKNNPYVYVSYFNYRSKANPWPEWMGAMHGYELEFIFGIPNTNENKACYTGRDREMSDAVITRWNLFAWRRIEHGGGRNFDSCWPHYEKESPVYVSFTEQGITVMHDVLPRTGGCKVFNRLRESWKRAKNITLFFKPRYFDV